MVKPGDPEEDDISAEDLRREQMVRYAEDLKRARSSGRALTGRIRGAAPERIRVLIVDDEKEIRLLVAATLGAERYELFEATRGTEALTLARAKQPSLIILDVRMPDLDGVEVCKLIRADPSLQQVPIIMVTAARNAEERRAGLEAGASRYLTKPFSPAELLDTVDHLLQRQ
jgi:DNA-binding response OmpR family regulator